MKKVLGAIMLGAGILIAGVSGLCSVLALFSAMVDTSPDFMDYLPAILILCLIPLAIGVGLIFGGRAVIRSGYEDDQRGM